ncbi:transposase [Streptomyces fructofermentans]|uniref:transposase n=1 Tax=Streptomyces fructofermentans TaxID=152141 RepID=UPI00378AE279
MARRRHGRYGSFRYPEFDAGKKANGRKRFIVADALGLLLAVHVVAANIQDSEGAKRSLLWDGQDHPGVQRIWADQDFGSEGGLFVEQLAGVGGSVELTDHAVDGVALGGTRTRWSRS